jgi:hypothetical protein
MLHRGCPDKKERLDFLRRGDVGLSCETRLNPLSVHYLMYADDHPALAHLGRCWGAGSSRADEVSRGLR